MTSRAGDVILRGVTGSPEYMLMSMFRIMPLTMGVLVLSFGQHCFLAKVVDDAEDGIGRRKQRAATVEREAFDSFP